LYNDSWLLLVIGLVEQATTPSARLAIKRNFFIADFLQCIIQGLYQGYGDGAQIKDELKDCTGCQTIKCKFGH
jgi:hypothetical protein